MSSLRTAKTVCVGITWIAMPIVSLGQASPFLTGATALQANIVAWLTPLAVILVMILGAMAMANRIIENCGSSFIFRCSASEGGGTARFASSLIGQRQVRRTMVSTSRRDVDVFGSSNSSDHLSIEPAVMDSEIEQIPDLCGYLKLASRAEWLRLRMQPPAPAPAGQREIPSYVEATAKSIRSADESTSVPPKPKRRTRPKVVAATAADASAPVKRRVRAVSANAVNTAQPRQSADGRGLES